MGRKWGGIVPSERKLDLAEIDSLVIAGWTGRNVEALEAHIKELEAIGVKRPRAVKREASGNVTAETTLKTPATAIAAAAIRRLRRRTAVASP